MATTGNVVLVAETAHAVLRYLPLLTGDSLFSLHFLLSNLVSFFYELGNNLPLPPPEDIVLVAGAANAVLSNGGKESCVKPSSSNVVLIALGTSTVLGDLGIS